jgi:hypothetical protein
MRYLRHILPAAVGFFGVMVVWAGPGYLPQAGPVPLRFRVLPPPQANLISHPDPSPVSLSALLPPVSAKLPVPTVPTVPTAPALAPVLAANPPAVEYDVRDSGIIGTPALPPDGVISPQMLIKYFTLSTNATGMSAAAPVGFTPPTVAVPVPPTTTSEPNPPTPP